jgi:DNA-directed RNA polymerase specialized sigma24 family protein
MTELEQAILDGFATGCRDLPQDLRPAAMKEVLARLPEYGRIKNYAFTAGRNWAIEWFRKKEAKKRREALNVIKAMKLRKEAALREMSFLQFKGAVTCAIENKRPNQRAIFTYLEALEERVFNKKSPSEVASDFCVSNTLVYKWCERARAAIKLYLDKDAWNFISRGCHENGKFKKAL